MPPVSSRNTKPHQLSGRALVMEDALTHMKRFCLYAMSRTDESIKTEGREATSGLGHDC